MNKKIILAALMMMGLSATANAENEDIIAAVMDNTNAGEVWMAGEELTATEVFGIEDIKMPEILEKGMPEILEKGMPEILKEGMPEMAGNSEVLGAVSDDNGGLKTYRNWLGEECIDFGDSKTYYNWKRDVTYVGAPIFLSSFIIKDKKRAFRSARFSMNEKWKTEIDNYTQFSPYAVAVALKALGYDGRSSWDRLVTSAVLANAVMAVAVNATKYSVGEMRPDNSTANSFPSGHTATAFVAATVLHKEYGLTRSPWFSVGGYAVAMGTGFMRVLNNRHWISDVIAGAGIGILSTELGYFLGDLIYKNHGITRLELKGLTDPNHPSFFDIQMGIGMHKKTMEAAWDNGDAPDFFELGTSTAVGVEGAYFFNKYVGVGGMARVTTTPVKGLGLTADEMADISDLNNALEVLDMPGIYNVTTSNSNFIDGSFDAGIYGNLPLGKHFSLGAKLLAGVRVNGGFEYKANVGFKSHATDQNANEIYTSIFDWDGNCVSTDPVYIFERADGSLFNSNETLMPGVTRDYNYYLDPQRFNSGQYSFVKLTGGSSLNFVCGLSATYRYKDNFSWKIFIDYDNAKNKYNYNMHLFNDLTMDYFKYNCPGIYNDIKDKVDYQNSFKARLDMFTIGAAFEINF